MAMLHSEQMIDLKGSVKYEERDVNRGMVHNDTAQQLEHVGVIRRTKDNKVQINWVGTFMPGAKANIDFMNFTEVKPSIKKPTPTATNDGLE